MASAEGREAAAKAEGPAEVTAAAARAVARAVAATGAGVMEVARAVVVMVVVREL